MDLIFIFGKYFVRNGTLNSLKNSIFVKIGIKAANFGELAGCSGSILTLRRLSHV